MRETIGTIYEAFDGAIFTTKYDCEKYEAEQELIKRGLDIKDKYDEVMEDIKRYCGQMLDEEYDDYEEIDVCVSNTCPFYNENCSHNCIFSRIPYVDD